MIQADSLYGAIGAAHWHVRIGLPGLEPHPDQFEESCTCMSAGGRVFGRAVIPPSHDDSGGALHSDWPRPLPVRSLLNLQHDELVPIRRMRGGDARRDRIGFRRRFAHRQQMTVLIQYVVWRISRFASFDPSYCVRGGAPSSSLSSSPPRCAEPSPCSAIVRSVTSAPVTAYRTGASALCTSSDTVLPATNARSRCRTSSNVQIGQIGKLSPYSACNFMNSASDMSSTRGIFVIPAPIYCIAQIRRPG